MRERDIETYLVERVKAIGGEVRKVKWVGRSGAPDRFVMLRTGLRVGEYYTASVWVELKAPGEKAKPHQLREHKRMHAMGQLVEVIDSFEGVDRLLGISK